MESTHSNQIHLHGLPNFGAFDDLVTEVQSGENGKIDVCAERWSDLNRRIEKGHEQDTRNPDAVKL